MAASRARSLVFTVRGPLRQDDLPGLYARICALLEESVASVVVCEVQDVAADAVCADALARLQLAARRRGARVLVRGASGDLRELIAFMGLSEVLPQAPLGVEPRRKPEQRQ